MKKVLIALAVFGVWAAVAIPVVSAVEPKRDVAATELPSPYRTQCFELSSFEAGCVAPEGPRSAAYIEFAAQHGLTGGVGGARVKWFPSRSRNLDQVLYVVGPYLTAVGSSNNFETIEAERATVSKLALAMQAVDRSMELRDVSIVYIGFGRFEHAEQPVAQRVVATKAAIEAFEVGRTEQLGRTPESTALIGLSLGGVVAKIALSELESEGFNHGVDTYISFDSPHFGAYTPPSLQMVPMFFEAVFRWLERQFSWTELTGITSLGDSGDDVGRVTQLLLESPVAQDLLSVNMAYEGGLSPNVSYIRDRYRQLPSQSRNVAVASGSVTGQRPDLADRYFSIETGSSNNVLKQRLNLDTLIPTSEADNSFFGQASFKALLTTELQAGKRVYAPENPPHYPYPRELITSFERAPCAHSTEIVEIMVAVVNKQIQDSFWPGFSMEPTETRACFIPTFSAVIGDNTSDGPVPNSSMFDRVIGDSSNKPHLATTSAMDSEILAELNEVFPGRSVVGDLPDSVDDVEAIDSLLPVSEVADILEGIVADDCDFNSGSHDLEQAQAMFPGECDRPWNPETDKCDYDSKGWRCYELNSDEPIEFADLTAPTVDGGVEHQPEELSQIGVGEEPDVDVGGPDVDVGRPDIDYSPDDEEALNVVVESNPTAEVVESNGDCDFKSGTHNLDETRAMFPKNCGREWNPAIDKCDYSDDGWHCFQNS